jgi:hypothetical protein
LSILSGRGPEGKKEELLRSGFANNINEVTEKIA